MKIAPEYFRNLVRASYTSFYKSATCAIKKAKCLTMEIGAIVEETYDSV
jgi:hypothetical protein